MEESFDLIEKLNYEIHPKLEILLLNRFNYFKDLDSGKEIITEIRRVLLEDYVPIYPKGRFSHLPETIWGHAAKFEPETLKKDYVHCMLKRMGHISSTIPNYHRSAVTITIMDALTKGAGRTCGMELDDFEFGSIWLQKL